MWNSLPDAVVNSSTINQFKNKLDINIDLNKKMMYDYKADLTGILIVEVIHRLSTERNCY